MHAPLSEVHQEQKYKDRPSHQAVRSLEIRLRDFSLATSSLAAQTTVRLLAGWRLAALVSAPDAGAIVAGAFQLSSRRFVRCEERSAVGPPLKRGSGTDERQGDAKGRRPCRLSPAPSVAYRHRMSLRFFGTAYH
jgi:hypothetical protein